MPISGLHQTQGYKILKRPLTGKTNGYGSKVTNKNTNKAKKQLVVLRAGTSLWSTAQWLRMKHETTLFHPIDSCSLGKLQETCGILDPEVHTANHPISWQHEVSVATSHTLLATWLLHASSRNSFCVRPAWMPGRKPLDTSSHKKRCWKVLPPWYHQVRQSS